MAKNKKFEVIGSDVSFYNEGTDDYISLTDLAKHKNADHTGVVIAHWLSTRYTVEFMGIWERVNNPNFNVTEFSYIKNESGSNGYVLSAKQWIEKTKAIGIISKAGRYGGTYAHKDIAFEFATWISPELKFYLIKEFQRLKEAEHKQLGWDIRRQLTKINYRIHTDAVKENLIPAELTRNRSVWSMPQKQTCSTWHSSEKPPSTGERNTPLKKAMCVTVPMLLNSSASRI